jgi:molybdenum cofactor guanylyltransferase
MILGALIAGGLSTRYGAPKALAHVGGERIVDRVLAALAAATAAQIAIVNDPAIAATLAVPSTPDLVGDAGALGGIHAALARAGESGADAVLAVGCDTPFLPAALLRELCDGYAAAEPRPDVFAAESGGPRGIEPLCAVYAVRCLPAIEAALERGDRRLIGFHADVTVGRLPLDAVRRHGDPATLFLNVNTPEDRARAERLAEGGA